MPTDAALVSSPIRPAVHVDDYKTMTVQRMSDVAARMGQCILKELKKQKIQHDPHASPSEFAIGERVFILMPAARSGPAYKLVRPFHGPFWVIANDANVVEVHPADCPKAADSRLPCAVYPGAP